MYIVNLVTNVIVKVNCSWSMVVTEKEGPAGHLKERRYPSHNGNLVPKEATNPFTILPVSESS